ncbi:tripartite tricarboxylate transporter permease [Desulfosporosinus shakirovi]|uniref:tripartite tricarboxylate transporter permease n=1 Tax=Desulfosporosinus shakirovi TaxID=2885154 RepID=UPI001E396EBB|nr:tripartite tricarboxylate transporter permease [Desulfosporosinus sp. SRJS8]MCB8816707.1 tripartite tricarboxylate transporter permease [Desulfosporosinus sp. SRJS8]
METLHLLLSGFATALQPDNLLMAAIGAFVGTLVGALPGLGPTSAIAILLPLTAVLSPTKAIIMLAGIYYGAMYGGASSAILLGIPGDAAAVATCLDGHPMAKQGRGGPALGTAAFSSFAAGTMGVIALVFFGPLFADQALKFGPPEYFALMLLALTVVIGLGGASISKALAMGFFGYLLSLIGLGTMTNMPRLTFGYAPLWGGLDVISLVIGLFAISEVLNGIEEKKVAISMGNIGSVFPTLNDLRKSAKTIVRGGTLGFFMGLLPGVSAAITTFLAYDLEKKCSKTPERFGHGAIEGVAAPESANNATSSAGFITLFALGIPGSPPLAVLLGGLMIYGLTPGPMLFQQNPDFVWAVIASMFIGNAVCLVLNLPLVGLWAKLTQVPFGILAPIILLISIVGTYTIRNDMLDVLVALIFGILGYFLKKFHWPLVPLIICFILGPMLEKSLLQSFAMAFENPFIFFQRPISLTLIVVTGVLLIISIILRRRTNSRIASSGLEEV